MATILLIYHFHIHERVHKKLCNNNVPDIVKLAILNRGCWRRSHVIGRKMWEGDVCGRLYIGFLHITLKSIVGNYIIFGYVAKNFVLPLQKVSFIKLIIFPISIFALIARISPCFNLVATQHLRHFEFS